MLEHGGNLRRAQQIFGHAPQDWLDLSTGLNPHAYPAPPLPDAIWHRLPESDPALASAACAYYDAPALLAVAGTQAAIQALPRLRAPCRVALAAPSYAEHAHQWRECGHQVTLLAHDALAAAVDSVDVMVVCNPDNPTGTRMAAPQLLALAARLAARGGWLVVDEAFADTEPQDSVARHSDQPGLIVLRSIGKFFGLAGLRLGFVGAHASVLAPLADLLGPWAISSAAQHIGLAALRDQRWQDAMRARLNADGARLHALLAQHRLAASGCALFQCWREPQAEAFWRHMGERRIWVRRFDAPARAIRLGLPPDEGAWEKLTICLNEWTASQK